MENITYYLGAGASYNSLPLYSNFHGRLQIFHDYLFHCINKSVVIDKKKSEVYLVSLKQLISLLNPNDTTTVDILANRLYGNYGHQMDLYKLKYLISDFFVFEQLNKNQETYFTKIKNDNSYKPYNISDCDKVNTIIDNRYEPLILPLLDHSGRLPNYINFISWNYDLQIELSYAKSKNCSINLAQTVLQVYPSPETMHGIFLNSSSVIKLNGTAGIYYPTNAKDKIRNFIYERSFDLNESYLVEMFNTFDENKFRVYGGVPFFKFYFEKDNPLQDKALKYANEIMMNTDVLVIIGYTFHTSNRDIDKAVFKDVAKIRKVVIQVQQSDFENVKSNFLNIKPELENKITLDRNLTNFVTPNNL